MKVLIIKIEELLNNAGIIRNRKKIEASINNAKRFLEVKKEWGSFDNYIWSFVDYKQVVNHWEDLSQVPVTTELSDKISNFSDQNFWEAYNIIEPTESLESAGLSELCP